MKIIVNTSNYTSGLKHIHSTVCCNNIKLLLLENWNPKIYLRVLGKVTFNPMCDLFVLDETNTKGKDIEDGGGDSI